LERGIKSGINSEKTDISPSTEVVAICDNTLEKFSSAMDDDLNTAAALAVIFDFIRFANTVANTSITDFDSDADKENIDFSHKNSDLKLLLETLKTLTGVLGLMYTENTEEEIPQEILDLVEQRKQARKDKNFQLADEIRTKITDLGYTVEETRNGTVVKKI
jgi:cysteinyl-tRNA synthetase